MKVDFYQLGRDPAEKVIAGIARNTLKAGERLLVVSGAVSYTHLTLPTNREV